MLVAAICQVGIPGISEMRGHGQSINSTSYSLLVEQHVFPDQNRLASTTMLIGNVPPQAPAQLC